MSTFQGIISVVAGVSPLAEYLDKDDLLSLCSTSFAMLCLLAHRVERRLYFRSQKEVERVSECSFRVNHRLWRSLFFTPRNISIPDYLVESYDDFPAIPEGIRALKIGVSLAENLPILPASLKVLHISYIENLPDLPHGLEVLTVWDGKLRSEKIPRGLKELSVGDYVFRGEPLFFDRLPDGLVHLDAGQVREIDMPLKNLPRRLRRLRLPHCTKDVVLPSSLKQLRVRGFESTPPAFPEGLLWLRVGSRYSQPIRLPESLEVLILGDDFRHHVENIPGSLWSVTFGRTRLNEVTFLSMLALGFIVNHGTHPKKVSMTRRRV